MIQAYFKSNIWVIFKQCYSVFLIKLTTAIISASTPLYCHCNRDIFEKKLLCCLWDCMPPILSLLLTKFALNTACFSNCAILPLLFMEVFKENFYIQSGLLSPLCWYLVKASVFSK